MTIEQANREYAPLLRGITLDAELGRGSSSTVYAATDTDGAACRIKIIRLPSSEEDMAALVEDGYAEDEIRERFETAMRAIVAQLDRVRRLELPTIAAIEDRRLVKGKSGELLLLVRSEPLMLFDEFAPSHDITANDVLNLGLAVCGALAAAGDVGVLHGNLKPSNLFVAPDGTVCVADFAEERLLSGALDSVAFDSLAYMAPELQEDVVMSTQTDLYSLGIILYSLFNNRCIPFLGRPDAGESAIRRAIHKRGREESLPAPANADEAVATMLAKACALDPGRRYASPAAFADDLRDCLLEEKEDYVVLPATETIYEIRPLLSGEPEKSAVTAPVIAPAAPAISLDDDDFTPTTAPKPQPAPTMTGAFAAVGKVGFTTAESADAVRAAQQDVSIPAKPTPPPASKPTPVPPPVQTATVPRIEDKPADPDDDDYDDYPEDDGAKRLLLVLAAILALLLLFGGIVWGISALTADKDPGPSGQNPTTTVDRTTTAAPTTNAPSTTEPETTDAETTDSPTTTESPATTEAPSTTAAPETTAAPNPSMPRLQGESYENAAKALTELGFTPAKVEAYHATVAAGKVISQSIAAGAVVKPGQTVTLTVSLGREQNTVPSVVGKTRAEAEAALTEAGFKVSIKTEYSKTVARDSVIAQDKADQKADVGTSIAVTVSLGERRVTLENLVGKSRAEVEAYITANELTAIHWEYAASTDAKDTVVRQSISAGDEISTDTTLILYLSEGGLSVPNLLDMDEAAAIAILRGCGYIPSVVYQIANTEGVIETNPAAGVVLAAGRTVTITVGTRDASATALNLPMGDLELAFAQTVTLAVEGAQGRSLTYATSNAAVADVDANGKITANGTGYATITVTAGYESVTCSVRVVETSTDFTIAIDGSGCIVTGYRGRATDVIVPDQINGMPVIGIGANAFAGKSITSIRLPDSVTAIAGSAFENCAHLTTVHLPAGLTTIGDRAFASCAVLRTVDLPHGVTSLGASAFERCYELGAVYLPANLTNIGAKAFRYCSSVTIYAYAGSPSMAYATENGLTVKRVG